MSTELFAQISRVNRRFAVRRRATQCEKDGGLGRFRLAGFDAAEARSLFI